MSPCGHCSLFIFNIFTSDSQSHAEALDPAPPVALTVRKAHLKGAALRGHEDATRRRQALGRLQSLALRPLGPSLAIGRPPGVSCRPLRLPSATSPERASPHLTSPRLCVTRAPAALLPTTQLRTTPQERPTAPISFLLATRHNRSHVATCASPPLTTS